MLSRRDISLDSSDEDSTYKFECCRFVDRNWESVIAHELILVHVCNFFSSFFFSEKSVTTVLMNIIEGQ
jgi:hypothetical protein